MTSFFIKATHRIINCVQDRKSGGVFAYCIHVAYPLPLSMYTLLFRLQHLEQN